MSKDFLRQQAIAAKDQVSVKQFNEMMAAIERMTPEQVALSVKTTKLGEQLNKKISDLIGVSLTAIHPMTLIGMLNYNIAQLYYSMIDAGEMTIFDVPEAMDRNKSYALDIINKMEESNAKTQSQ